ncbi:FAD-dependent pyridine nucleotide-disulfide oxidoreductase [Skermanella stibiiresistens SB22]|uniref:FAD-dependent pyridine nucleotide-disulfide oxidoreductase n=1 Tax=Skermanella stibiiresistens SB22 TaxID=1385369 RepID=W9H9U1_9PROT|nr:FAD-dependent oxidoreductase [Skermanella stibiiresistens]EWY42699.1 FAD-dependent pyridine nucleotide-disulfide oxidoreductase [Skermanella stibiiresistens SB22]
MTGRPARKSATPVMTELSLGFGLTFSDLYEHAGLVRLDRRFVEYLGQGDGYLGDRLLAARACPGGLDPATESALLIDLAPHVDDFIGRLFGISRALGDLAARHHELAPLYAAKRLFVQRRAAKAHKPEQAAGFDGAALTAALEASIGVQFDELTFAKAVMAWSEDEPAHAAELDLATRYAAWALHSEAGRARHGHGVLFQVPRKTDPNHLVPLEAAEIGGVTLMRLPEHHRRQRQGFGLTDPGTDLIGALDEVNYCILCHTQDKDSCSKGLRDRKTGQYQRSPFGVTLTGCPLEERISEAHTVKAQGHAIGALAMIVVDNPLCAATGHRICNDCMKACIYQKQEPVDIPQAETRTLKDVLELPWGFEIYSLLTRWNPLDIRRPHMRPDSGYKVLVVGLGPAGFTLAHHLMNDGHTVVGIDGLKIEPLPADLSGVLPMGRRVPFRPIHRVEHLQDHLDERIMAGFGGVAEYGITVRWDKNFLKMIRLLLERRRRFVMVGGVRFGGTLTIEDAFAAGFDHVALCAGAGRPTVIPMRNGLARGVRQASDFLMGLQLTGAAKEESIANLEVRLPIVVVGGGLTAIDTATESLAYYPVQVEKFLRRFETLAAERGEEAVRRAWSEEEGLTADEFIAHARAIRAERERARVEGYPPRIRELLDQWGGATVAYRRRLIDAPSYTLNHEEVEHGLAEGIRFLECVSPRTVEVDRFGHAAGLRVTHDAAGPDGVVAPATEDVLLPARTILIAAGTQPNTVLAREEPDWVELDGRYFQALDEDGHPVTPERSCKPGAVHVLMSRHPDGRSVSFFGDLHPSFAGNVVKAMSGAKQGYPVVSRVMARLRPTAVPADAVIDMVNHDLRATVHHVVRLTPNIVEVVVKAPRAAARFQPGQFYRLQNFETLAHQVDGTTLAMEGLALTGASVDREHGLLSTIVLEMGGSSDLCALLKAGDPVILMGPTGTATEIPENETVCLVGGGLGNAVLFSIGQACRAKGNRVVYFAGYKKLIDRYKVDQIEAAADLVVWCSDEAPGFEPTRPGDRRFVGNIVRAIQAYAEGGLGVPAIPLNEVDRIVAIGSDRMMHAVALARHTVLAPHLKPGHVAIGSINSPMQCMMKEICAQCLQAHKDPVTGAETVVFSCFKQDQDLDRVDFAGLNERLRQNGVQEKLTAQWIDRCLKALHLRRLSA